MSHINVIRRRSGIYGYRRVVPEELRATIGPVPGFANKSPRVEFVLSLGTTDKRQALRLAAVHDANVERAIRTARAERDAMLTASVTEMPVGHVLITPEQAYDAVERWRDAEKANTLLS